MQQKIAALYDVREAESIMKIIFSYASGIAFTDFYVHEKDIDEKVIDRLQVLVAELLTGKPVQYVTGETEFYGLSLHVSSDVLIPRPETEELVEWIIAENKERNISILDIGTGSGCISIALAKHLPAANVYGVDISQQALDVAQSNAAALHATVDFSQLDILSGAAKKHIRKYDVIVSNPPYVCESEKPAMHKNVLDFEPPQALFVPDNDPLLYYRAIADFAQLHLLPEGTVYFEINEKMGEQVEKLLKEKGFKNIHLRKDIHEKNRMICGIL